MAATRQEPEAITEKHGAFNVTTDIDVIANGDVIREIKDVDSEEAFHHIPAALIMASMGFKMELRVSNLGVYEMMQATVPDRTNLKVTLRGA